jgi:hypothetical protein
VKGWEGMEGEGWGEGEERKGVTAAEGTQTHTHT